MDNNSQPGSNGIAYASISSQADLPGVNKLIFLLATGAITENEYDELVNLVLNKPNSRWSKLDLNAQTVEVIAEIPLTTGFGFPNSNKFDTALYFQLINPDQNLNGFYEYNSETNSSFNSFNVTAGGSINQSG